jgi:hypothetical protein
MPHVRVRLVSMSLLRCAVAVGALTACASGKASPKTRTKPAAKSAIRDTVEVRDPDIDRRLSRLELRVMERETQVDELQTRLEDARDEVVRTMAKLQTLASRAEAASAMAETDVALQSLRTTAAGQQLPEIAQASKLQQQSNSEFNKQNFGGALYLANQAKAIAASGRTRAAAGSRVASRAGETPFALPIRIKVANRGNVREGPGTNFGVSFAVAAGDQLTAYSMTDDWVRVSDDSGRAGWIFRALVGRP